MLKPIFIILLFLKSFSLLGQDIEFLHYLNAYRIHHNEKKLSWSPILYKNSLKLNTDSSVNINEKDVLFFNGGYLPNCFCDNNMFSDFLKKEFNIVYKEPSNNIEVGKLIKLYVIFLIHNDKDKQKIILDGYKYVGFDFTIENINYISNKIVIDGKSIELPKFKPYYEVNYSFVIKFEK